MVDKGQQQKLEKLLDKLETDRKVYNWVSIALSILDVVCGLICIAYSSLLVASVVVSALTGVVIAGRTVQIIKAERLARTLGVFLKQSWVRRVFSVCLLFITTRIKRGNTKMAKWLKANKFSILMGIIACGIVAGACWFVIAAYWAVAPLWAHILITVASGLVSAVGVYFLGAEKWVEYALRISAKKLEKEKQEQLVQVADNLFAQAKALEEAEKKEEELKAKAISEARAELEAKQKAELEHLVQAKLQEIKNTPQE
jgi:hypothetical protein